MSTTTAARPRPGPQPRRRAAATPTSRDRVLPTGSEPTYVTRGGAVAIAAAPERTPAVRPRPARQPARPDLKVVRPDQRRRRGVTPVVAVLLTVGIFGLLLAVAVAHTLLVSNQVHLDQVDRQVTTQQARYQQLREQVAEMESPDRIVAAAQKQGMVSPPDLVYLQPRTEVLPATTDADEDGTTSDDATASPVDASWSTVKPLLEAPAP